MTPDEYLFAEDGSFNNEGLRYRLNLSNLEGSLLIALSDN